MRKRKSLLFFVIVLSVILIFSLMSCDGKNREIKKIFLQNQKETFKLPRFELDLDEQIDKNNAKAEFINGTQKALVQIKDFKFEKQLSNGSDKNNEIGLVLGVENSTDNDIELVVKNLIINQTILLNSKLSVRGFSKNDKNKDTVLIFSADEQVEDLLTLKEDEIHKIEFDININIKNPDNVFVDKKHIEVFSKPPKNISKDEWRAYKYEYSADKIFDGEKKEEKKERSVKAINIESGAKGSEIKIKPIFLFGEPNKEKVNNNGVILYFLIDTTEEMDLSKLEFIEEELFKFSKDGKSKDKLKEKRVLFPVPSDDELIIHSKVGENEISERIEKLIEARRNEFKPVNKLCKGTYKILKITIPAIEEKKRYRYKFKIAVVGDEEAYQIYSIVFDFGINVTKLVDVIYEE